MKNFFRFIAGMFIFVIAELLFFITITLANNATFQNYITDIITNLL